MHINEFREFFKKAGVKFSERDLGTEQDPADTLVIFPEGTRHVISVTQCNFLFTEAGNFLGTFADEMAYFEPKLEVN